VAEFEFEPFGWRLANVPATNFVILGSICRIVKLNKKMTMYLNEAIVNSPRAYEAVERPDC